MRIAYWLTLLLPLACVAQAATVYRSVDPEGRVTYSDKPPPGNKVETTFNFANLPATPMPDSVLRYREELQKSMQQRLSDAQRAPTGQPVLFTAKWCGYCTQAKAYLAEKGISYQEHDIDTPAGMQAFVSSGAGGKGVPVLLVNERRITGYSRPAYDALFTRRK